MKKEIKKYIEKNNIISILRKNRLRARLKNNNPTILSSNCLGGLIYHELGLRFQSPTVNIRFSSVDFVKFVLDIDHYLKSEFVEIQSDEDYPVALLDDITVHFVHYHSFEDAVATWKQRCQRMNWENIFVILNDCDGISNTDIVALDNSKYKNIIMFTAKQHLGSRCAFYLPRFKGETCVGNLMKKDFVTGELIVCKDFDFVGWFNQEKGQDLEQYRK